MASTARLNVRVGTPFLRIIELELLKLSATTALMIVAKRLKALTELDSASFE
jgi:hypothetical protein